MTTSRLVRVRAPGRSGAVELRHSTGYVGFYTFATKIISRIVDLSGDSVRYSPATVPHTVASNRHPPHGPQRHGDQLPL